jgi:hypothetical protein
MADRHGKPVRSAMLPMITVVRADAAGSRRPDARVDRTPDPRVD